MQSLIQFNAIMQFLGSIQIMPLKIKDISSLSKTKPF